MRIAILWASLSGYLNACLKELAGREGVELFVSHMVPDHDAPFDISQFSWIPNRLTWKSNADLESLGQRLDRFAPNIIVFSGWHVPAYRRAARESAKRCWRVLAMDRCWLGNLKQIIGTWTSPYFVRPLADAIWVPGERQSIFAKKLGFKQQVILRGLYSCDQHSLKEAHLRRLAEGRPLPQSFLFIGRFVPEKGIDTLVSAYSEYRQGEADPWPLVCCGAGPLQYLLENKPGIYIKGFVQPDCLVEVMASAGCLILPSQFEPWGLVIHEAASAGRLILASESAGAAPHLVQPGYNGFIFDTLDVSGLADVLSRVGRMHGAQIEEMANASYLLSKQFSPVKWADALLNAYLAQLVNPRTAVRKTA